MEFLVATSVRPDGVLSRVVLVPVMNRQLRLDRAIPLVAKPLVQLRNERLAAEIAVHA